MSFLVCLSRTTFSFKFDIVLWFLKTGAPFPELEASLITTLGTLKVNGVGRGVVMVPSTSLSRCTNHCGGEQQMLFSRINVPALNVVTALRSSSLKLCLPHAQTRSSVPLKGLATLSNALPSQPGVGVRRPCFFYCLFIEAFCFLAPTCFDPQKTNFLVRHLALLMGLVFAMSSSFWMSGTVPRARFCALGCSVFLCLEQLPLFASTSSH